MVVDSKPSLNRQLQDICASCTEEKTPKIPENIMESVSSEKQIREILPDADSKEMATIDPADALLGKAKNCTSKVCAEKALEQQSDCCISVQEKIVIKHKLDLQDNLAEFLLVEGPIYVRKSVVDEGPTIVASSGGESPKRASPRKVSDAKPAVPQKVFESQPTVHQIMSESKPAIPQKVSESKQAVPQTISDSKPSELKLTEPTGEAKNHQDCQILKCGIKELLRMCDNDPDAIIRMYEERNAKNKHRTDVIKESDLEFRKTHGDVFGDEKYHYLMVDNSTSYDTQDERDSVKKIQRTAFFTEEIPTVTAIDKVEVPSAEDILQELVRASKTKQMEIISTTDQTLSTHEFRERFSSDRTEKEPERNVSEPGTEVSESGTEVSEPGTEVSEPGIGVSEPGIGVSEPGIGVSDAPLETLRQEPESIPLGDIIDPVYQGHRVSIVWDDVIDPTSKLVKVTKSSESMNRDRRVSAISWKDIAPPKSENDQMPTDDVANYAKGGESRGVRKSVQPPPQKAKNSIFEEIVREERKKKASRESYTRGKSIVEAMGVAPTQKNKWWSVLKNKRKYSTPQSRRKSLVTNVALDDEDVESDTSGNDEGQSGERRSTEESERSDSINSYRRRSMPVENAVHEKNRAINQYLNNV